MPLRGRSVQGSWRAGTCATLPLRSVQEGSGSAFTVYAHWPLEDFELSGDISSFDGRGFCPRCGSRLMDTSDPGDSHVEIRLGTLDDAPFDLKPEAEIWVKRRESWILPVEGAAQYDENRRHGL